MICNLVLYISGVLQFYYYCLFPNSLLLEQVSDVLDGDLDGFVAAYLRSTKLQKEG